jgi:carboxyl-terminal processing protease
VTAAAAATSPAVGSLSSDVLDAAVIRGTLAVLDPYSRYISPQALSRSLLVEGSDGADAPAAAPPRAVSAAVVPHLEPSVRLRMENGIALTQINRFTASTGKLLRRKLASAAASGALQAMILDMRDNPGGDISSAVEVARLFLRRGIIVAFETRDPADREVVSAHGNGDYGMLPLVVLVNGASASAAEIVAAALQENKRALIIGSPSFGKGTIQSIFNLANGGELWVTSAYSRAPSGYFLQHHGVLPDICVTLPMITSGGDANGFALARAWQYQSVLARPRAWLNEAQWTEARQLCPPASASEGDDRALQLAMAIIRGQLNARGG